MHAYVFEMGIFSVGAVGQFSVTPLPLNLRKPVSYSFPINLPIGWWLNCFWWKRYSSGVDRSESEWSIAVEAADFELLPKWRLERTHVDECLPDTQCNCEYISKSIESAMVNSVSMFGLNEVRHEAKARPVYKATSVLALDWDLQFQTFSS